MPMSPGPIISIITPVYNCAGYLRETLESVRQQDYPAIEHIVINDGSTDASLPILKTYAESQNVRLVDQPNRGEIAAINSGAELATGKYLMVVNADDPILPGLVSRAIEKLESNPELAVVYPDWHCIDAEGVLLSRVRVRDYDYQLMLEQSFCLPGPGAAIRRAALGGEPLRDARFRYKSDFHLFLRLGMRHRMARLPGYFATWRDHSAGATFRQGTSRRMAEEQEGVIADIFARSDLPSELRRWQRLAYSVSSYLAAMVAMYTTEVPGRRLLARSFALAPVWPSRFDPDRRRSLSRIAYVLGMPVSRWLELNAIRFAVITPRPAVRDRNP